MSESGFIGFAGFHLRKHLSDKLPSTQSKRESKRNSLIQSSSILGILESWFKFSIVLLNKSSPR